MEIRWLSFDEIETLVNPDLKAHNWPELNLNEAQPTCRVLGSFIDGVLIESFTFQLFGMLGPMIKHQPVRDSGEMSRQLAEVMHDFLEGVEARDYLVVANSPVSERLSIRFKMQKLKCPVYVKHPGEATE